MNAKSPPEKRPLAEALSAPAIQEAIDEAKPKRVTETPRPRPVQEPEEPRRLPQSFRLPEALVDELIDVSARRKRAKKKPWSHQDIVAAALRDWFDKQRS